MKRLTKWKKILFSIVFVLVAIRILYIGVRGEVDKEYYTSSSYDLSTAREVPCQNISGSFVCNEERLNSLELIFNNIADDKSGSITFAVMKSEDIIYQTDISLSNINNCEWKKIYVNIDINRGGGEYRVSLNSNEGCTQIPTVFVVNDGSSEITNSYKEGAEISGKIAINFGYLRFPGIFDRLSIISLWMFFLAIFYMILFYFEKIMLLKKSIYDNVKKIVNPMVFDAIIEVLAGIIIINSSGIEFQESTKVIIYIISLISVIQCEEKKEFISRLTDMLAKKVFLYLLYVYAAFALVGQRILIYPLTLKLTIGGIFVFIVAIVWFIPLINTIIFYLDKMVQIIFSEKNKIKIPVFVLLCTCILLIPALYNLFANNPGISSPDTVNSMIINAQNLHGMYDWHPAFYCMVLRVIAEVSNTTYAVIMLQYFFWAYVMNELFLYLRKKGVRECVLIGTAIFFGFNASNFIHINTIWKDIPYTLSLLWAFVILAKLSIDYEEYKRKWYIYLEFTISMIGIFLYRKNGMVSFIIIAVAVIIVLRKNIRVWISVTIAIALVITIKGPIYRYFEVEDSGRYGIYIGLGQDVLGVYYAGGEVSENTLKMITMMTDNNNTEYSYIPTWSNASYEVDVTPVEFIKNYIDTFIKNPIIMIRAIIAREDALWDIFMGQDSTLNCVNYYETEDEDTRYRWNDYYPKRHYVSLYTGMSAVTDYTANTQWISAIEWRSGLFTLLGLLSILFVIFMTGFKKYLVILAPIVGQIMSLLLSTGWSDFRYYWPINLMNVSLILIVLVVLKSNMEIK